VCAGQLRGGGDRALEGSRDPSPQRMCFLRETSRELEIPTPGVQGMGSWE
jgi:hypothetical protein